ncbi:Histidine kinase-, DNA gyrase B-, and HSP90-like ATPase [Polynucleobacter kasalickyi]|uniref:Histidine kinase-, DNA gyrase B-, and HSP90-like ATPase n=2 Tax=Polynucleobacter kasalickyi TaxID=1938817 RepID=A0A1W1YZ21_9BURK|nr:Histidine kinase-, DNA gyrase B-, and HSP90-like ATPase [Polynucleobacter kasalickyi]
MSKPSKLHRLIATVTKDVMEHPNDLTRHYMAELGISRVAANNYINQLEEQGWIARSGPSTRPVFSLGYKRHVSKLYEIDSLEEDIVWIKDFRPYFNLSQNVLNIVNHGFTEMLNNAIDHSGGGEVFIWARQTETRFTLAISDNGIGIFAKIASALKLPDMRQALFELSKGKFTTDPSRHSGEGVFFTSRMFDWFEINANNLEFHHDNKFEEDVLHEAKGIFPDGTVVFMSIALNSTRTTADIYAEYTNAPDDFDFSKTVVPMKLAQYGEEHLVSRSQAKRLIARFDRFKKVVLNFDEVQEIGQAFADEIFRVYANKHPDVELIPKNMTKQVEKMWLRAVAPRI